MSLVSYVKNYRVSGSATADVDTSVVQVSNNLRSLTITGKDGEEEVTLAVTGPRGGTLGGFRVYRQTLRDLVDALETEGLAPVRKWSKG
jgi:hypothetical protein